MKHWLGPLFLLLALPVVLGAQEGAVDWIAGPATVNLGERATVRLKEGFLFANAGDTRRIMQMTGNEPSNLEMGLVAPVDESQEWFLIFEYFPVGYVSDEDKDEIDAAALLESISEATEGANDYRRSNGFEPIHVVGWHEEPHYDEKTNNLLWALEAKNDSGERTINYNVRILGRQGYTSVTLVTDPSTLASDKRQVEQVLGDFDYKSGQRYAEFREGDKLAGYGLTALVAGGAGAAAVKLGLFAKLSKLLAKAWKLVLVGFLAVLTAIKKIWSAMTGRTKVPA